MSSREATCSCGGLRVVADGEPVRVSGCHGHACQRRTGSAFGLQARFARERVTITGASREYVRMSDEDGSPRRSYFCPDCGSTVYYLLESDPEMVAVPVGAFADPAFPAPTRSVWEVRRHAWVTLPPGAERIP